VGLTIQDIDHDLAQHFGSGDITGALIADVVAGDPADEAGLRAGDVILEVGGAEVTGKSKATQLIAALPVGEPSDMVIWRDGREMTIQVTPARRGEGPQRAEEDRTGSVKEKPELSPLSAGDLGIDVVELTSSVRRRYQIPDDVDGVLVSNVNPLSPAIEKGLIEGNIVSEVNGNAVETDSEFYEQVDSAANEWTNSGTSALFKLMIQDQDGIWRPIYAAIPFE
jgi:serine protease Do